MKTSIFYLSILCILLLACNYIPCSSSSDLNAVKRLPRPSLISGVYKPDKFTKQDFKEYSSSNSTFLSLTEDGRITLRNFPTATFGSWNKSNIDIVNGSGTWSSKLESGTVYINANIAFDQKEIMKPTPFRLFTKSNKYYILIDFGDPDGCTSVRLEQQ
jgi:hypothetical protein